MIKKCTKCGIEKDVSEFGKYKKSKDGLFSWCKRCRKESSKNYYNNNKDKVKDYQQKNKDIIAIKKKENYIQNKEKIAERKKEYYIKNRDKIAEQKKEYKKVYEKKRYKTDPEFRLMCNIRRRVRQALKSKDIPKTSRTAQFVDVKAINEYLGPRPEGYHLDHIIPLSKFDLTNLEHLKLAFLPQNLRYIPALENCSKNDTIIPELIACSLIRQQIAYKIGLEWKNLLKK